LKYNRPTARLESPNMVVLSQEAGPVEIIVIYKPSIMTKFKNFELFNPFEASKIYFSHVIFPVKVPGTEVPDRFERIKSILSKTRAVIYGKI